MARCELASALFTQRTGEVHDWLTSSSFRPVFLAARQGDKPAAIGASSTTSAVGGSLAELSAEDVAVALAGLSKLLASRLGAAAASAADADDQAACAEAARHAGHVLALLGGAQEP